MSSAATLARTLVLRHGWNATAYQLLNPGFELWISDSRDGVVGYVKAGDTHVAGGAPACDEARVGAVAREFEAAALAAGSEVCWVGAGARLAAALDDAQHAGALIGALPWWQPGRWVERVGSHRSLRAQFNRARNKGVRVTEWPAERVSGHPGLESCLREWLSKQGLPPLHFLVEPNLLGDLRDRRIFVAEQGDPVAYLVLTPIPARAGWLAEQIVRRPAAPNGATELLVDTAVRAVAAEGSEYFTLGVAPLSQRAGAFEGPAWLGLASRWGRAHGKRFYNFGGLEAFKAKFQPDGWESVWLLASHRELKFRHLHAVAAAYAGGSPLRAGASALGRAIIDECRRATRSLQRSFTG